VKTATASFNAITGQMTEVSQQKKSPLVHILQKIHLREGDLFKSLTVLLATTSFST